MVELTTQIVPEELRNGAEVEIAGQTLPVLNSSAPSIGFDALIGHLHTAEHPEDIAVSPEAYKITPTQRTYCALRVRGFSSAAACRKMNINQMAASRWANAGWFDAVCEEERNKWLLSQGIDKRVELMTPLMGLALDALKSSLISEDEKIRMAAVDKVFETFFESEKRPVGRPPNPKSEIDKVVSLSDIQERSKQKINELRSNHNGHVDIRANA